MTKIFVHGTGHRAASWRGTLSHMKDAGEVLCPDLGSLLGGREAAYSNLYASFAEYCNGLGGPVDLCGLSLGGVLALEYALEHPENVRSLALIGTPYKVPKGAFALQNVVFRFLPKPAFEGMAFGKRGTIALTNSLKDMDLSGRLGEVKCPTLIVCGERDRANMEPARYLAENIKGARLRVIEGAGHVVNEEAPEALAGVLEEFFGGVEGR